MPAEPSNRMLTMCSVVFSALSLLWVSHVWLHAFTLSLLTPTRTSTPIQIVDPAAAEGHELRVPFPPEALLPAELPGVEEPLSDGPPRWQNPLLAGCVPVYPESEAVVSSLRVVGAHPEVRHNVLLRNHPRPQDCVRAGWKWREGPAPRIFLGLTFNLEVAVLLLSLRELHATVDFFVVVESAFMNSGLPKPLYYDQVKNTTDFLPFRDQVIHVPLTEPPQGSARQHLKLQRQQVVRAALAHSTDPKRDLIVLADCDEVPKPPALAMLKACDGYSLPVDLGAELYLYRFGCLVDWLYKPTVETLAVVAGLADPGDLRGSFKTAVTRGAWHLSSFFTIPEMIAKVRGYSHQERNTPENQDPAKLSVMMQKCMYLNGKDRGYTVRPSALLPALPSALLR
eukprot:RCo038022